MEIILKGLLFNPFCSLLLHGLPPCLLAGPPGPVGGCGGCHTPTTCSITDPYYLDVGKTIVDNLNEFSCVSSGIAAAIKDLRNNEHEDR